MNKKGFTMIELLAAIVILGILSVLAIVGVSGLIEKSKEEDQRQQENTLKMAAESYYSSNRSELPKEIGKKKIISASDLKKSKYLKEDIKDKNGDLCMSGDNESYVEVYKKSETKYIYKSAICGRKESKGDVATPTAKIYLTDSTGKESIEVYKNVKTAKLVIKLNGGARKSGQQVAIEGYSFSLSVKGSEGKLTEVYNSGTVGGENKNDIVLTEPVTNYIDISGVTELYAEVEVINKDGESAKDKTDNQEGKYHDQDNPKCNGISTKPVGENDWIGKYSPEERRSVTMKCNDGEGSGCKRPTFTRTWPDQQNPGGAEWGYIQVVDNVNRKSIEDIYIDGITGIDGIRGSVCDGEKFKDDACRVRVNVDVKTPTIEVRKTPLKSKVTAKDGNEKVSIPHTSYQNNVNNWLNAENYSNGIEFTVDISDNIRLASYTWEVNYSNQTTTVANDKIKFNSKSSEAKTKEYGDSNKSINCGETSDTIKIGFKDEGKRQGKLTVYDKAGNYTIIYITAYLDRTKPAVPKTNLYKWKSEKTAPISSKGLEAYSQNTWHKGMVYTEGSDSSDTMSGVWHYEYVTSGAEGTTKTPVEAKYKNIVAEGITYIAYRAVDVAGNPSNLNENKIVKLDRSGPTIPKVNMYKWKTNTAPTSSKSGVNGVYDNDTWIDGKVYTEHSISTDAYSGNETIGDKTKIYYQYTTTGKTKNETNQKASYRNIEAEGVSYIKWKACDPLGNCSAYSATKTVKVDRTNPSCSIKKTSTYNPNGVSVKVSCSDSLSGVSSCPGSKSGLTSSKTYSTTDKVGRKASCSVKVYSTKQYRYIQKVNKTCNKGDCCGWNTVTKKNCNKCDSKCTKYEYSKNVDHGNNGYVTTGSK